LNVVMLFPELATDRLLIRPPVVDDIEALHARRNDPEVARYQNWELPWPRERAEAMVRGDIADRDEIEGWNMLVITERSSGETLGDLAVNISWEGRCSEIGYTLDRRHWGHGYATEAAEALVAHLFEDVGVTRVSGMLHPDNPASARVLERVGMLFEGHTRLSFWVGEENSDDHIYGMTRADWEQWRDRPRTPPESVELGEIGPENRRVVGALATHKTQEELVAPMSASFADALFPSVVNGAPVRPWMRAIVADGTIVGFVMMTTPTARHPEPFLWRLLIDRLHQRRGIGREALELIDAQCRQWGVDSLTVSWATGPGSPERFYLQHGFVPTGILIGGEVQGRKYLD
jgi:RimJ/RimL family protein N-acetyltransferase